MDEKAYTIKGQTEPDPNAPDPYNVYRYNSKRWDPHTQNYDMGFRDYDPGINRFLSRDMYNGALDNMSLSTDPLTMNRYAYAGGNPISMVEFDGHIPVMAGSDNAMQDYVEATGEYYRMTGTTEKEVTQKETF
jgi:RHS repeat-associated protein